MNLSLSRRNILQGIGMTALAGVSGATLGSLPARAGVGWGPGPKSGLPFWLGAHGDYAATTGLLPAGRGVDLVNLWETENTYMADAAKNAPVPVRTPKGWASNIAHKSYLATGQTSAVQWSSSPFCSGPTFVVPNAWPSQASDVDAGVHLNCSVPPTYTGAEDPAERRGEAAPRLADRRRRLARQCLARQAAAVQEELLRQLQPAQHPHRHARRPRAQHQDRLGQTAPTGAATA